MEAMPITCRSADGLAASAEQCSRHRVSAYCSSRFSSQLPLPKGASPSFLRSSFLCSTTCLHGKSPSVGPAASRNLWSLKALRSAVGEDPEWSDDDFLVLGLAHCFQMESGSLKEVFLVEPLTASTTECLDNGGATAFKYITGSTLGVALKCDVSLLPSEFASGKICNDFDFRAKCAARTWKRTHAVENLMNLSPVGTVRSEFNFSLADKRVINKERVVTDADNIKQDMSIDVYGRSSEASEDQQSEIASLYNA